MSKEQSSNDSSSSPSRFKAAETFLAWVARFSADLRYRHLPRSMSSQVDERIGRNPGSDACVGAWIPELVWEIRNATVLETNGYLICMWPMSKLPSLLRFSCMRSCLSDSTLEMALRKDRWHLIARCCLIKARLCWRSGNVAQRERGGEPRMCLHSPDTMKSGFNFRRQRKQNCNISNYFRGRLLALRQRSLGRITFDQTTIPSQSGGRCAMLKSLSSALEALSLPPREAIHDHLCGCKRSRLLSLKESS